MLVLSRKYSERIVLTVAPSSTPTRVVVTVVRVSDANVRLGVEAPRSVDILRGEVEDDGTTDNGTTGKLPTPA